MRWWSLGLLVGSFVSIALSTLRWLRIAQREHYLAGQVTRFARRWWRSSVVSAALWVTALVAFVGAFVLPGVGLVAAGALTLGPVGLSLRGRTGRLAWTRRLQRVAVGTAGLDGLFTGLAAGLDGLKAAALVALGLALVQPVVLDCVLALLAPLEDHFAARYVERATHVIERVRPRIVAITGSYGKTSTKGYVAHLLEGHFGVVASPRSFNNRAGLARTVNELVLPGTDVLIAEMGTYGLGEIASMCSWLPPEVAVITAIGPVHLERFGSLQVTLAAKSEILAQASSAVLNIDDPLLGPLAARLRGGAHRVIGASALDPTAEVALLADGEIVELFVAGERIGTTSLGAAAPSVARSNVACALGVALALGLSPADCLKRLVDLPVAENRLTVSTGASGARILDDTFNSNPEGAALALRALGALVEPGHRAVLVTPGMVELGSAQDAANRAFARDAAAVVTDLVVVNRTNRHALLEGARSARDAAAPQVRWLARREDAVAFVRSELGPGDAVLYENDLPDHYP